jgi:hypothetical protein
MNTNPLITTVRMSKACRDAVNKIAESLNVSAGQVIESALEALQYRSIPANVLLPFDTLRALELTASSTRRLGVLLSRLEILILTARRGQLDAADRLLAEMAETPSTPEQANNHEE